MDKLFVLLILTPAVLGVKNCCFPSQFECVEGLVTGSADDEGHTSVTTGNLQLSYDASGRRIYILEQLQTGNSTETYTLIQLYNENMQYIIHNGTCTGGKLGSWDNRNCIPDNATAGTNFIIGHQQSALVTPYMWTLADGTSLTMTVTDKCTPLSELTHGTREGTSFLSGLDFKNIKLGIKDPTVFVVPDICKQQPLSSKHLKVNNDDVNNVVNSNKALNIRPIYSILCIGADNLPEEKKSFLLKELSVVYPYAFV